MSEIDRAQKRRRTRALIIGGCGLALVGLSMLISVYVSHGSDDATLSAAHSPATRQAGGAIVIGGTGARMPRVEIFEDFPAHKWLDYHDRIYKNQPAEGAKGFSNDELIGWAKELGFATPSFEECVTGLQRQQQLNQVTDHARDVRKLAGTPALFLNGKSLYGSEAIFDPKSSKR